MKAAVIVVDVQADFTTWKNGSLAVPGADEDYVKQAEFATRALRDSGLAVFATQDWHLPNHISLSANHPGRQFFETIPVDGRSQVLWPPHCVQGTEGAEILIDKNLFAAIVRKGQNPLFDSYSGFKDDGGRNTEMNGLLKQQGITDLVVYGIATDYCVCATALDAIGSGYKVVLIENLCRGVARETSEKTLREMKERGVRVTSQFCLTPS